IPRGILLYGPPGCGKTLMARALAGEAGAAFFSISGSDFVEVYVGVGAARVRDLFAEARRSAPAVVFIDELDSVGRARAVAGSAVSHGEQEQALNQILTEMDGFSSSEGILVVGATNRPDVLDQALLRPGRFDRAIGLERPDEAARLHILALHARRRRLDDAVDLAAIARRAIGLTGADLANLANEAALLAARADRGSVSQAELDAALARILEAPDRQRRLSVRERSVARRHSGPGQVTFADVAGVDDAVAELAELVDHLADPAGTSRLGGRPPRGVLLCGPPGCGKTLLARALAGEANAGFFSVAASEFVEVFVGEGSARVRELFAEARSMSPAIVFIDEIDAVGGARSGLGHREHDQTLNQILVELDGFDPGGGLLVMAATNRADMLDPALVRPGRFDRRITVALPDRAGRRAILDLHAGGKVLADDVDLDAVSGLTAGFSGADLANALNEAALLAARRGLPAIPMTAVEEGIDRATMGITSKTVRVSDDDRRVVAYHEAGHGLATLRIAGMTPPHKLSIVPRGDTLGRCTSVATDRVMHTRSMLVDLMTVLMAGRAAEAIVFADITSGSVGDLQQATDIARRMVCELGMSDAVGPVSRAGPASVEAGLGRSEEAARLVDREIRRLLEQAEDRATALLVQAREELEAVAEALLTSETLSIAELALLARSSEAIPTGDLAAPLGASIRSDLAPPGRRPR
ncbi:MAG: AAA family ATPase, partial [Acidimicrobiales bacterium]